MKGLFLTFVVLVFAPVQASADWRCPRGSKQVEQIYAGGMLMAAAGPTCIDKRFLKSKNIPVPPSCESGSFAYYSNESWSCMSQSAGAPSTLAPGAMTACGMIGQPSCGTAQSGPTEPSNSTGGANYGGGLYGLESPQYTNLPTTQSASSGPSCPSGATLTSTILTRSNGVGEYSQPRSTALDPPVCIVSFDPGQVYPQPPTCQSPSVALYAFENPFWVWTCRAP
jgi:hypothetical protein